MDLGSSADQISGCPREGRFCKCHSSQQSEELAQKHLAAQERPEPLFSLGVDQGRALRSPSQVSVGEMCLSQADAKVRVQMPSWELYPGLQEMCSGFQHHGIPGESPCGKSLH